MARSVANPLGQAIILLVIVSAFGFAILHLAPGGPLSQYAVSSQMTQEDLDRVSRQLGLDRPLPIQYLAMAPIVVAATLNVARAILLESYVSYLGYGIQPPAASWGNMLN